MTYYQTLEEVSWLLALKPKNDKQKIKYCKKNTSFIKIAKICDFKKLKDISVTIIKLIIKPLSRFFCPLGLEKYINENKCQKIKNAGFVK